MTDFLTVDFRIFNGYAKCIKCCFNYDINHLSFELELLIFWMYSFFCMYEKIIVHYEWFHAEYKKLASFYQGRVGSFNVMFEKLCHKPFMMENKTNNVFLIRKKAYWKKVYSKRYVSVSGILQIIFFKNIFLNLRLKAFFDRETPSLWIILNLV